MKFLSLQFLKNIFTKPDEKAEKANTEFLLMVVHKLKTSLAGVKWSLKMLLDGDFGQVTAEQENIIKKIYKRNDVMISSVNDLLDLSTIKDGTHVYNMKLYNVEDIILFVISDFQNEIKSKDIKFYFERAKNISATTMLDKDAIETVIQNLLDNAIKYTPAGGSIKVSLHADEKEIKIQVQDSGVGMPEQQGSRVFDKFFTAGSEIKIKSSSMHLGLFIAKNVIDAHHGKIWFQSKRNKGTTFYITLPVVFARNM